MCLLKIHWFTSKHFTLFTLLLPKYFSFTSSFLLCFTWVWTIPIKDKKGRGCFSQTSLVLTWLSVCVRFDLCLLRPTCLTSLSADAWTEQEWHVRLSYDSCRVEQLLVLHSAPAAWYTVLCKTHAMCDCKWSSQCERYSRPSLSTYTNSKQTCAVVTSTRITSPGLKQFLLLR